MLIRLLAVLAVLMLFPAGAPAATPDLSALRAQLATVRATHGANTTWDAGPELNPVKQALRTWVEAHLPPVPGTALPGGAVYSLDPDDLTALGARLSQTLADAGLTCGHWDDPDYRCGGDVKHNENERGYVDTIRITRFDYDRYLMVVTGVGIHCGFDQSAYLYQQGVDHHWHLLTSLEQDRYGEKDYRPENFVSIAVSPSEEAWNEPAPPPLVAAIGYSPWCQSNWKMLHTRLWRVTPGTAAARPVLDRDDELYIGDDFIAGVHLTRHDMLVQFDGSSIDSDILVRTHVLHYAIGPGDKLTRIAPVALNPGDFVEEWLTSPWAEASRWLAPGAARRTLQRLHATAYGHDLYGEFDGMPRQCRKDAALWQVSFAADPGLPATESRANHFLVRWQAPYEFTLLAASRQPFPGCDKAVTLPSATGTLFPRQGWTP